MENRSRDELARQENFNELAQNASEQGVLLNDLMNQYITEMQQWNESAYEVGVFCDLRIRLEVFQSCQINTFTTLENIQLYKLNLILESLLLKLYMLMPFVNWLHYCYGVLYNVHKFIDFVHFHSSTNYFPVLLE